MSIFRYVALALCAVLLAFATSSSSAQRRTAIRISAAGEATKPAPAPRKSERERLKQSRGSDAVPINRKPQAPRGYTPVSSDTETVGTPSYGELGVQKTSAEVVAEQAVADMNPDKKPRVGKGFLRKEKIDRSKLPQDPNAQAVSSTPALRTPVRGLKGVDAPAPNAPQTVSTPNFTGATLADTGAFPPDTMGAVGPTQFFVFLNGRLRTFNKTTGVADGAVNADSDVFFSSVMTPVSGGTLNINFTSDPNVRYDRLTRRWILTIIDVPSVNDIGDTPNRLLIAVTDAASNGVISGSTVFTFFFVQQDTVGPVASTGEFLDYPSLGIDEDALYVGGNMFGAVSGSFVNSSGFVIRKSSILGGGPVVTTAFRGILPNGSSDGPFAPRGVDNYATGTNEGYFIGVSNAAFGRLNFRRVTNPDTTPTISADILLTVASTSFPITVDHLGDTGGTAGNLDALDDRLFAAHIRNGRLWTSHNIAVLPTGVSSGTNAQRRNGVRWYELNGIRSTDNGGTPVVVQSGTIFDTAATVALARQFWIPTVTVSGQGHAAFGYSTAGTPFFADAATNGRLRTDALGTTGAFVNYTNTTFAYNPPSDPGPTRRWGDYSFTSLDPKDDMTMWTVQEFTSSLNNYGVRVVRLLAPPPATPSSASPAATNAGQASVNVVITGTSTAGSEFYDPGADIAGAEPFNHITATVSGGVTVNSVTFNSPTQVTLNINTTAAAPGPKNVTITNPDGQSATGNGILTITAPVVGGPLLISEFRVRGPSGANDEFIEIYNNTGASHTVAGGGTGYAVAASDGVARCIIPNGTVIPNRGHYLCTNSAAYSLAGYAAGDITYVTDIPDNAGIALFNTSVVANFTVANRFDAVGSTSEANVIYKEGTGYPALTPFSIDYSFVRDTCGKGGSITTLGACPTQGFPKDTDNNAADFYFVDTNGTSAGAGQRLGAPGPENLSSPIQRNTSFGVPNLDSTVGTSSPPNRVRDFTSDPANNSTFGTLSLRKRVVNNTGANVTRLRFRIVDLTTFPAPSGFADLRPRTSTLVVVSGVNDTGTCGVAPTPCTVTVQGTTLETPPSQPNGGGFNSTLSAGTVTLGTPLANGASINLQFLLGIQQTGTFKFFINVEALP